MTAAAKKPKPKLAREHELRLVAGVEGLCLYLNNFRLAGPKPWGGGVTRCVWHTSADDIRRALEEP
jgi:hypothetical protein